MQSETTAEPIGSRILREDEVKHLTGLSRVTRWRLERDAKFPRRLRLGENAVGWRMDEILEWIESRPRGAA